MFDDLQYVQLMAKEQHRRKRRLSKLKTKKKQLYHAHFDHNKCEEKWHSNRINKSKYNQTTYFFEVSLEFERKILFDSDTDIDPTTTTTTTTTTTQYTATLIIDNAQQRTRNDQSKSKNKQTHIVNAGVRSSDSYKNAVINNSSNDDDEDDDSGGDSNDSNDSEDDDDRDVITNIGDCFRVIECDFYRNLRNFGEKCDKLNLPSSFIGHVCSLYESASHSMTHSLLQSARRMNLDDDTLRAISSARPHEELQAVVIGSFLDELLSVFHEFLDFNEWVTDLTIVISQMIGDPIIWLRIQPGLNVFQWSTTCTNEHLKYECNLSIENAMYFSGYLGINENVKDVLNIDVNQYVSQDLLSKEYFDLDWCFVVFLLLGLVPNTQNHFFRWYFNQKLLSVIPGSFGV